MALTSGTVIDNITRKGDAGESGYSAYGQSLRHCTKSGSKDDWHGATQGSLYGMLPMCYITESVYTYLTTAEIESVRSRLQGIVPTSYAEKKWLNLGYGTYPCWVFKAGIEARPVPLPDPCAGVTCTDICIGADNYSQVCAEEGPDAGKCVFDEIIDENYSGCPGYVPPDPCEGITCEPDCFGTSNKYETVCDEGECIIGELIEANSTYCPGYVPPDDNEPDDEPDYEPDDEPDDEPYYEPDDIIPYDDGDTSELAIDIDSLLEDIKPVHILIAILAMIFLGLLS